MSIRTRIRQVGGKLAHRGWLGPSTGPLPRVASAVDRRLVTGTAGPAYVARLWDRLASDAFTRDLLRHSWTGLPSVHANHNYLVSGDRSISSGFFIKGGAGMAFFRNWVDATGPGAINSKALSVVIGGGWAFRPGERLGLQVFAAQHASALGDLQTAEGEIGDVIGNFWSFGAAIVFR